MHQRAQVALAARWLRPLPQVRGTIMKHSVLVWEIRVLGDPNLPNAESDTDLLVEKAAAGDELAREQLLEQYRQRLKRMVAIRLDRRFAARLDPSDVVQEALTEAAHRLDDYLRDRPMPYYPWLRRLVCDRLDKARRRHTAGRRNVRREEPRLPEESALELANRLAASNSGPSRATLRHERQQQVRAALDRLPPADREVLALRFLERLTTAEAARVLEITPGAVRVRVMRALERLRERFGDSSGQVP
jgi:RNA polymerase sigma-70 factor (ECF subfamily)